MKTFKVERHAGKADVIKATTYMVEQHILNFYDDNNMNTPVASFPAGEWLSVIEVK